jgi:plastocyanin
MATRRWRQATAGWSRASRAPLLALVSFAALAGQTLEVSIAKYAFTPAELSIRAGDTVRWVNREQRTSHSVLFPQEGGRESERLFPDESWARQFTQPGRYPYTCGPHPEMKGLVIVGD